MSRPERALHKPAGSLPDAARAGERVRAWCGRWVPLRQVTLPGEDPTCPGCLDELAEDAADRLDPIGFCDHGGGEGVCPYCGEDVPVNTRPTRDAGTAVLVKP